MAKENTEDIHFRMSYERLISVSKEKEVLLRRDQKELSEKGITIERLDAFKEMREMFLNMPAENTPIELNSKVTEKRDNKANELRSAIRVVLSIVDICFGKKSEEYTLFNIKNVSKVSVEKLYEHSQNVVKQSKKFKSKLKPHGLTKDMLETIETLRKELLHLIKETTVETGNTLTGTRRIAANNLYAELQSLCKVGANYYHSKDIVKSKEYAIYSNASNEIKREGSVVPGKRIAPKPFVCEANTKLMIKVKSGIGLSFYFGLDKDSLPASKSVTLPANEKIFFPFKASDLGFDEAKGIVTLIINNPNPKTAEFVIKIV